MTDMRQIEIRRSDHGGWMTRVTNDDDMTVLAQRVPTLGGALAWLHALANADQLYTVNDKAQARH